MEWSFWSGDYLVFTTDTVSYWCSSKFLRVCLYICKRSFLNVLKEFFVVLIIYVFIYLAILDKIWDQHSCVVLLNRRLQISRLQWWYIPAEYFLPICKHYLFLKKKIFHFLSFFKNLEASNFKTSLPDKMNKAIKLEKSLHFKGIWNIIQTNSISFCSYFINLKWISLCLSCSS